MSQTRKTSSAKSDAATPAKAKAMANPKSKAAKPQPAPTPAAPAKLTTKKTTTKKTTTKKTQAKKTPAKKRLTLTDMQKSLASLETRMKRADSLTRKSVDTLKEVVSSLDARTKKDASSQKSALSRRVGRLSNELEEGLATTQAEIKTALASALSNPNPDVVQTALDTAMTRLNNSERQQALAIAKINRHLANLAKAVEDRILKDQVAAAEALHLVEQRLSERLETIEADTTEAIGMIGDKVANLSDEISKRNSREDDFISEIISERISGIAAKTQADVDASTQALEARIKQLEIAEKKAALALETTKSQITSQIQSQIESQIQNQPSDLPDIHLSDEISALSKQIDTLQSRLDTMDANFEALQTQSEIMGQDLMRTKDNVDKLSPRLAPSVPTPGASNIVSFAQPAPAQATPAQPSPAPIQSRPLQAPLAGAAAAQMSVAATFADEINEYVLTETVETPVQKTPQTGPIEYNPADYQPQPTPQALHPDPATALNPAGFEGSAALTPPPFLGAPETQAYNAAPYSQTPPSQPLQAQQQPYQHQAPINYNDVDAIPAGDPMLPYADPAYAEERMDAVRIGETETKRSRKPRKAKKPKSSLLGSAPKLRMLTGRNVRVAAMATGLTLIGLFAAKSILFGNSDPLSKSVITEQPVQQPMKKRPLVSNEGPTVIGGESAATLTANAAPTIGVYAENQAPIITASEAGTLQDAANKGDAIAQFQLGLSQLEQNNLEDGVKNIRLASQTLPAAQYRLAKIYEAGEGVEKNTEMAKDLTERAARAGNRIAMHDLAIYYAYGNGGVDVDMGMAAGWFEKAAERGVVDSQFNLAILYENGQGVKPNLADAYFWYSIAASQGDQAAKARLQALDSSVAPAEIEAAKDRIANFTPVKINQAANGIFKNLPWNQAKEDRQAAARKAEIKQAQTLLADMGFEVGFPDGIMGKKTRQAITRFEQGNGMEVTGKVSADLIDKLSLAAGA